MTRILRKMGIQVDTTILVFLFGLLVSILTIAYRAGIWIDKYNNDMTEIKGSLKLNSDQHVIINNSLSKLFTDRMIDSIKKADRAQKISRYAPKFHELSGR